MEIKGTNQVYSLYVACVPQSSINLGATPTEKLSSSMMVHSL
jgi:hypothetical protein